MRGKRTRNYGVPVACATTAQSLPPQDDANFAASQRSHFIMKFGPQAGGETREPPGRKAPAARLSSSRVDWPAQPSLDLAQNYFSRISWIVSIVLLPPLLVAIRALA